MSSDTNTTTVVRAANAARLRDLGSLLTPAGLRALTRQALEERGSTYATPWQWADDQGLYFGEDGAWLFHTLPLAVVGADTDQFDQLLTAMARQLGDRKVHLLMYGWEEAAAISADLTEAHADYVRDSLRILVPGRILIVGAQLREDPEATKRRTGMKAVFHEVVDRALGEWVPPLEGYGPDRARVAAVFEQFGGTPVRGSAVDMLEAWYALGISHDITVEEQDDSIVVRGPETIELVSIRSFHDDAPAAVSSLPPAGDSGTLVVSARGTLTLTKRPDSGPEQEVGMLSQAGIIIGRRVARLASALHQACSDMAGLEVKPLPMRQLPALGETLPTSASSVDPHLFRVDAAKLRRAGFNEPIPAGDRSGLLVGMVEPNFSYPLYLDLFAEPGYVLNIAGRAGSGKTFLVEHLATQARLARRRVLVLAAAESVDAAGLPGAEHAEVVNAPVPGLLDPFAGLDPALAPYALAHVLRQALPDLSAEDHDLITRTLTRAAVAELRDSTRALRLVRDPVLAAKLVRFSKTPAGRLLCTPAGAVTKTPSASVWHAAQILAEVTDPAVRTALVDLMVAVAESRTAGGLLVADGIGDWSEGTAARAVWTRLGSKAGALIATTRTPDDLRSGRLLPADTDVVLACGDGEADGYLAARGVRNVEEIGTWLTTCDPAIDAGVVSSPATGFVFDAHDNQAAFLIGPVPRHQLEGYTRGRAHSYRIDQRH